MGSKGEYESGGGRNQGWRGRGVLVAMKGRVLPGVT